MSLIIYGIISLELLLVAWIDLKTHKISNKWSLINILLAVVFHVTMSSMYPLSWEVFLFPLGFIAIGFVLFLVNIMGAGDSKYLASLFLIVPTEYHVFFFEKLLLTTMFVGAVLLSFRILKNFAQFKAYMLSRHWSGIRSLIKSQFSYAPIILLAWILLGVDQWK